MESNSSLRKSQMVVYYWAKFLGLAPVTLKNNRFHRCTLQGKFYPMTITAFCLLASLMTFIRRSKNEDDTTSMSFTALNLLVSQGGLASIRIMLVSIGDEVAHLLNDLCVIGTELKTLGIVEDHGKYFRNLLASTITGCISVVTAVVLVSHFDPGESLLIHIIWLFKDLTTLATVLIFTQILICIRQRFAILNEKLDNGSEGHREDDEAGSEGLTDLERIKNVRILHSKLCNLLDRTTELFSGPIVACTLQFSSTLLLSSYRAVSNFVDISQLTSAEEYGIVSIGQNFVCPVLMTMIVTVQLSILLHVCATTCKQGNAARDTLFRVWDRFDQPESRNQCVMFSCQMTRTPVAVSAFGLFDLDYTYLCKIFGVVFAYLIVMIQLRE